VGDSLAYEYEESSRREFDPQKSVDQETGGPSRVGSGWSGVDCQRNCRPARLAPRREKAHEANRPLGVDSIGPSRSRSRSDATARLDQRAAHVDALRDGGRNRCCSRSVVAKPSALDSSARIVRSHRLFFRSGSSRVPWQTSPSSGRRGQSLRHFQGCSKRCTRLSRFGAAFWLVPGLGN